MKKFMKKLKKSSKNKKPVIVFIYGPFAVGKLTVAQVLSKKLGYKLSHNHLLNDFLLEIFDRHSYALDLMKDKLRSYLLENAAKAGLNVVATHCYSHNYISRTGLSDPKFVQTLEKKITKLGAKFCPVHLQASNKELLKRVSMDSRKAYKKLISKKIMLKEMLSRDFQTSPKLKNNLIIDNTNLSAPKVASMIIKHFKLK